MVAGILGAMFGNNIMLVVTQFLGMNDPLIPLVGLAILISGAIVAAWYLIGAMLNSNAIKATAKGEAYQLLGTILLLAIILFALYAFSSLYITTFSSNSFLGTQELSTLCYAETGQNGGIGSPLVIAQELLGPPSDVCGIVAAPSSYTAQIDYPLAASTVITAKLASSMAVNFNNLFTFDAWVGFLTNFKPTFAVCIQDPVPTVAVTESPCLFPLVPIQTVAPIVYIKWSSQPYAGLEMIYKGAGTFGVLIMTALTAFILQLITQNILLNIWPFLIFLGVLFRATAFTRRLGGLMIAIAIGGVMIYPALFTLEYMASTSITANPANAASTTIQYCTTGPAGPYTYHLDFYNPPDIGQIAYACGCWPGNSLFGEEITTIVLFNNPITGIFNMFQNLLTGWWGKNGNNYGSNVNIQQAENSGSYLGEQYILVPCGEGYAINALLNMIVAYGITGVTAYFLPIINILITISSIRGLSGLLGGDTDLAGLSRLI